MEKYDYSISFIRLLAMCMIVACHIMQALNMQLAWWFNVGVQIFLCISGYLYSRKNTGDLHIFFKQRLLKILVPYYISFITYGIVQFFYMREDFEMEKFLRGLLCNATINGGRHLWFVSTIIMCYMITPLLQNYRDNYIINGKNYFKFSFWVIIIANIYFGLFEKYFSPAWMTCYIIGYLIGINEIYKYIKYTYLISVISIFTLVGNGLQIYFQIKSICFQGFGYFNNYNHVFLGVFIFISLKKILSKYKLGRFEMCLKISDKYSYEVYLIHNFIILGPFSLIYLTTIKSLNICIIVIIIIILSYLLKVLEIKVLKNFK